MSRENATPAGDSPFSREPAAQEARLRLRAGRIKRVVLILSGKGGVGKTTVAVQIARALATKGLATGLLDADLHGPTVPIMMGLESETPQASAEGLKPVPAGENLSVMSLGFLVADPDAAVIWRGPLKTGALRQFVADVDWGPLDYLIVDCPPGTGDEPLTVAQMFDKAAWALVVTTPQRVAVADARRAAKFARLVGLRLAGVIENMSGFDCPHCGGRIDLFREGGGEGLADAVGVPLLGRVPFHFALVLGADHGDPDLGRASDAADAFARIADGLINAIERESGARE
ncbi:MAG: Mrp/NBP35 family ATP-binding protein [Armatimonadota bacterium]